MREKDKQERDKRHSLHQHQPTRSRLPSRHSFIKEVEAEPAPLDIIRKSLWQEKWQPNKSNLTQYNVRPSESLPHGWQLSWPQWRALNRVRTGKAATPSEKMKWGYQDTDSCACGISPCNLDHLLKECQHYGEIPTMEDLKIINTKAKSWLDAISDTI